MSKSHYLYRLYDAAGVLLYVGISKSAIHRLHQHLESQPWADQIASQTIQRFPSRQELEAAERSAIKAERPRFNKTHNEPIANATRQEIRLANQRQWVEVDKQELRTGDNVALALRSGDCLIGRIDQLLTTNVLRVRLFGSNELTRVKLGDIEAIEFAEDFDLARLFSFRQVWQEASA